MGRTPDDPGRFRARRPDLRQVPLATSRRPRRCRRQRHLAPHHAGCPIRRDPGRMAGHHRPGDIPRLRSLEGPVAKAPRLPYRVIPLFVPPPVHTAPLRTAACSRRAARKYHRNRTDVTSRDREGADGRATTTLPSTVSCPPFAPACTSLPEPPAAP